MLRVCTANLKVPSASLLYLLPPGVMLWQLIEYCIHRYMFHAVPRGYWAITLHFLFHGCHHKYPTDSLRLVFPPLPAALIASTILAGLWVALPMVRVRR